MLVKEPLSEQGAPRRPETVQAAKAGWLLTAVCTSWGLAGLHASPEPTRLQTLTPPSSRAPAHVPAHDELRTGQSSWRLPQYSVRQATTGEGTQGCRAGPGTGLGRTANAELSAESPRAAPHAQPPACRSLSSSSGGAWTAAQPGGACAPRARLSPHPGAPQ